MNNKTNATILNTNKGSKTIPTTAITASTAATSPAAKITIPTTITTPPQRPISIAKQEQQLPQHPQ